MIQSIATTYNGVNFRSRLEAKYACMFDQLKWRWNYEPLDLDGYIPDFIIETSRRRPILVEVKPIFSLKDDDELAVKIAKHAGHEVELGDDWAPTVGKFETLICGAILPDTGWEEKGIGWIWEGCWASALVLCNEKTGRYGLCHSVNSYHDRLAESDHGGHPPAFNIDEMWKRAGNAVQWNPR